MKKKISAIVLSGLMAFTLVGCPAASNSEADLLVKGLECAVAKEADETTKAAINAQITAIRAAIAIASATPQGSAALEEAIKNFPAELKIKAEECQS